MEDKEKMETLEASPMGSLETYSENALLYQKKIVEVVGRIHNEKLLKRIYDLAEYLYIYK